MEERETSRRTAESREWLLKYGRHPPNSLKSFQNRMVWGGGGGGGGGVVVKGKEF